MSPPGVDGCANTSLITIAPGLGIGLVSSPPGEPFGAVLARQPSAEPQSDGRLQRIADRQREAVAVGVIVPLVTVGEILHDAAVGGIQPDFLSRTVQVAAVLAGDQRRADAGVANVERRLIGDDQDVLVRREGDVGKGERDALVEPQPRQRQRVGADVLDLDVLEIVVVAAGVAAGDLVGRRRRSDGTSSP